MRILRAGCWPAASAMTAASIRLEKVNRMTRGSPHGHSVRSPRPLQDSDRGRSTALIRPHHGGVTAVPRRSRFSLLTAPSPAGADPQWTLAVRAFTGPADNAVCGRDLGSLATSGYTADRELSV